MIGARPARGQGDKSARRATGTRRDDDSASHASSASFELAFAFRAGRSRACRARKPGAGIPPAATPRRPCGRRSSRIGCRSCRFQSRKVSRWPLKAASAKSGPLMKSSMVFGSAELRPRRGFADHPHRRPGLHVARGHPPRELLHESVLQLRGAPLLVGADASWSERGRPSPRPAADPRSGTADRRRTPRSRPRRPGHRRPARLA